MPGALLLAIGALLLTVPSLLIPAALRVRGAARPGAVLISAAAVIVLLVEVLSLVHGVTQGWMLLGEAVVAAAAAGGWRLAGAPSVRVPHPPGRDRVMALARQYPLASTAVGLAGLALLVQAVMAVAVAPNNWDSMSYHLARIAYWLQYDSALHFTNGSFRQLGQPPNGEFIQLWTMLVSHTDRLTALPQWVAATGLGGLVALGARVLGFERPAAAFAGALFVLLPQPLLQASSTQNDLMATFFVLAAVVYAARGVRDHHAGELTVAALALGLAMGTKGTALIALPAIGLLLVGTVARWHPPRAFVLRGVAVGVVAIVALGAFNYVLNLDTYGAPLGDVQNAVERESPLGDNTVRFAWSFADSPGVAVPWLENRLSGASLRVFGDLRDETFTGYTLGTRVQEDESGYGLLALFVLMPILLLCLFRPRSPRDRRVLALAAIAYIVVFLVANEYNPWISRVLMPGLALGAPLLALLYRRPALAAAALGLALLNAVPAVVANEQKNLSPAPGQPTVLSQSSRVQQTLPRPAMGLPLDNLDRLLPDGAHIGLVRSTDSWDYTFFGRGLERTVVPLTPAEGTRDVIARRNLDGLVYADVTPPRALRARRIGDRYWLARP